MNIEKTLHKGPRVLVPILIDAMVVDDDVLRITRNDWARNKAEYNNVVNNLGPAFPREIAVAHSISSFPQVEAPEEGVHLQWVLPKGLRTGKQNEQGQIDFPLVPNRWLVMRVCYDASNQLQLKGWIIQSDYLREPFDEYRSPYILTQDEGEVRYRKIGNAIPLEEWPGERAYDRTQLTAVGPEDLTFSSYTVNNENVFSFHDDLAGLNTAELRFSLGYVITGWYGDQAEDPLYQDVFDRDELLAKLDGLRLEMGDETGLSAAEAAFAQWSENAYETLSPLMLCHGAIHSIEWPWTAADKEGRPERNANIGHTNPDIIVGNSSFDALATFIGNKLKESGISAEEVDFATDLIYAFDQKLLNDYIQPDGENLLENKIHRSWFIGSQAGDYWEIVQNNAGKDDEEKERLKRLLTHTLPILSELNQVQQELDKKEELKEARLQQLYTALYAVKKQRFSKSRAKKWRQKALAVNEELKQIANRSQELKAQIEQRAAEINNELNITDEDGRKSDFNLRQRKSSNFWEPDDPVVLVHAAKTAPKYTFKTPPACRYSGQFIDKLQLKDSQTIFSPDLPPIPNVQQLPKETGALIKEFVLLNPNFTPYYFSGNTEAVQKQQTFIWNSETLEGLDADRLLQESGFQGIDDSVQALRPDFRSFKTFTPPWSPLFMDWVVYYFPDQGRTPVAESYAQQAIENWELKEDRFDYSWKDLQPPPPINDDLKNISWTIQGRSLIASQTPQVLIARLQEFKKELIDEKKQEAIETIIDLLNGFDLVTQRLNGFNEYLQRYDIGNQVPHTLLKSGGEEIDLAPLANKRFGLPLGKTIKINNVSFNQYFPIRSGHLLLHHTRIVDDFGLGFYPVGSNEPIDDSNVLVPQDNRIIPKGRGLDHPKIKNTGLIQLTPRITQPARIQMEWIDADADVPVSQEAQNSPVCGWIIPNHLDKSLMIFDANGKLQGSLIFFKRGNRYVVKKALDPVSANPDRFTIQNRHLDAFINELLAQNDQDGALSAFIEQIDKTTWVTDPLGAREKRGLSALIGRPLALVRSRVSMDLQGLPLPAFDFKLPEDYDTGPSPNPLGLMEVEFPYFVGSSILPNNGVLGYFAPLNGKTSYKTLYVTTDHSSVDSEYIRDQTALKTRLNHINTPENEKHYTYLSMLVDYRGIFHTITGLLPVFETSLPEKFTQEALANMEVTFRTGPLITDPYQLKMPKPGEISGKLSWIYQSGVQIWQDDQTLGRPHSWENPDIKAPMTNAGFPARRNQLSEGWLKLADALKGEEN